MSVRFDAPARRAIDASMEEADRRGHGTLDPAHLLLGLLKNLNAPAPTALELLGEDVEKLRATASAALRGLPAARGSAIEVDEQTEAILSRAAEVALEHGNGVVADIDILVACAERTQTRAGQVLARAQVTAERILTVAMLVRETSALRQSLREAAAAEVAAGALGTRPEGRGAAAPAPAPPAAPPHVTRVGTGYDSHRFAPGGPLMLGGVEIPADYHLAGHSDGDAIAHAITDAVLGAAGAGDIGEMFPDTDQRNRGRNSLDMLRAAVGHVRSLGWAVQQVDATLVAERPRLAPHRVQIRQALAGALGVTPDAVSVKGKSNEGMGWIGRGEGLACIAVATLVGVSKPR